MKRNMLWLWLPLIFYLVIILYLSSIPRIPGPPGIDMSFIHVPLYFLLSALFLRLFLRGNKNSGLTRLLSQIVNRLTARTDNWVNLNYTFIFAIICSTMYGIFIEIFQFFLPWRSFSLYDILLNLVGSCFVYVFISVKLRKLLLIPE